MCPVYRQIGGHAYGHTYPGPIGILLTAMLKGDRSVKELAHASSLCGACQEVCPVRIDIPRMLVELREGLDRDRIAPWGERLVFKMLGRVLGSPMLFALAGRIGRVAQKPFVSDGRLTRLPLVFARWTRSRDLPPVAAKMPEKCLMFSEKWLK